MSDSNINLKDLLEQIDKHEVILPDFQRDYVWIKDDNKIEEFIASVLAQLPLGNIITFKDDFSSFANKEIGFNKTIEYGANKGKVKFLLDGQQRVTTLSTVFSERIFNKVKQDNENYPESSLVQKDKIKKRYFLKIGKDSEIDEENFFGYNNLKFPYDPKRVSFCSTDITDFIETKPFTFDDPNDDNWFNPTNDNYEDYDSQQRIINVAANNCLIPLYLLVDKMDIVFKILRKMAQNKKDNLRLKFKRQNIDDIKEYLVEQGYCANNLETKTKDEIYTIFLEYLNNGESEWAVNMKEYLSRCIENLSLLEIDVSDENTARAINMYEALNRGGAKLTTYDLIIARAAKKTSYGDKSYAEKNKDIISEYFNSNILQKINQGTQISNWNSRQFLKTINKNDEIAPIVINQFLNLLCFVANNADPETKKMPIKDYGKISNDYCKAKKQLKLTTGQIINFSDLAMKSLMDTLMVLQFKCGVYNISQIDYNLILLPLSYAMYLYESGTLACSKLDKIINLVVGLYYFFIFTGEYQSDQSSKVMTHLGIVNNWLLLDKIPSYLSSTNIDNELETTVLNINKYNDLRMLLCEGDSAPKKAVRNSILQFVLAQLPADFIKHDGQTINLNAWSPKLDLEVHHIIPLATAKSIYESTKFIRNKNELINSPLNMAIISKEANRQISSYQIKSYYDELNPTFLSDYHLPAAISKLDCASKDKNELENVLKDRYASLRSKIIKEIKNYLISSL